MSNFLKAAASYYGLTPDIPVRWHTAENGALVLVAEARVYDEDLAGIMDRMAAMKADAEALAQQQAPRIVVANEQRLRDEYNGMDRRTKSEFGSFARYKAWRLGQAMDEVVAGPVEEPVTVASSVPPYVWLNANEITPQQRAMAVGMDSKGRYAVAVDDLTDEQRKVLEAPPPSADTARIVGGAEELRADYIARTVAARGTLDGSDGKPTSNADDFGGLPG